MKETIANPNQPNQIPDEWQELSDEAKPFKEHVKRSHQEKLQRFMELSGVKESRKNEQQFEESLSHLNRDRAYNYLSHINGILRGVNKKSERGRSDGVSVGDHVAPPSTVQGAVLSDVTESLKDINNNKYRAALGYYVVNGLHLFPDGNGRTSRATYEILENQDFDLSSAESLAHHTQAQAYGHGKFEKEKGIKSPQVALTMALLSVKSSLAESGKLNKRMIENTTRISMIYGIQPDIYLTEDAEQNLTDKEKNMVNRVFMDGDIATVSLGYVLTEKGTYDEVADNCTHSNGDEQFVTLEVTKDDVDHEGVPNEDAHKTFEGWTADDYRELIKTNSWVQKWQYDRLIDFFKTPEEYKVDENTTVAEYLTGEQN